MTMTGIVDVGVNGHLCTASLICDGGGRDYSVQIIDGPALLMAWASKPKTVQVELTRPDGARVRFSGWMDCVETRDVGRAGKLGPPRYSASITQASRPTIGRPSKGKKKR